MDEERFLKLIDKKAVGQRIEQFWRAHGFTDEAVLAEKLDYTNLSRVKKGTIPHWPILIKIAHACKSNLSDLINYIDPPAPEQIDGIEFSPKHRPLFVMLATILKNSEAAGNERRITGISVNLEDISAAASAEKAVAPAADGGMTTDADTAATKKQIARFTKKKKRMRPARDRPAVTERNQRRPSR